MPSAPDSRWEEAGPTPRRSPLRFGFLLATGALFAFAGFLALQRLSTIVTMLVASAFFTLGLDRPVLALMRRGMSRGRAVALLACGVLVVAGLVAFLVVPPLIRQGGAFLDMLAHSLSGSPVGDRLGAAITPQNAARLAAGLLGGTVTLAGAIFLGITTIGLTLFLLGAWPRVREGGYRFVGASRRDRARRLGDAMTDNVGAYLVAAVTIALFAGTGAFLWSWLTGVPYPLIVALVIGFADLIPQIGATLGSTVAILMALTVSVPLALLTLVFFCAYQGFENWLVYPRLMSRAVKISSLAAILSALVGGALYGILGVLIAVPFYACLQLFVREVVFPRQDGL